MPAEPPTGHTVRFELSGPSATSTYELTADEARIGRRDPDAGIYPEMDFDGNDIVVDGGERVHAVSRRHARVFREGDELKFEDLGSTNGSTLNGAPVLPHDPQPLKDGDHIVLGRTCRIAVQIA
jgi:pSer/pThr/pTyr-binding forkhead associated (FHA) protein